MNWKRVVLPLVPIGLGVLAAIVNIDLTPELLILIAGTTLALAFDYFPALSEWYNSLSEAGKKQVMFVLLLASDAVIFAGGCLGLFALSLACDLAGGYEALRILFLAIMGNQGAHMLLKPTASFKARMFARG